MDYLQEDLIDAIIYFLESSDLYSNKDNLINKLISMRESLIMGNEIDLSEFKIKFISNKLEDPEDLIDMSAFFYST